MKRREFVKGCAAAGLLWGLSPLPACSQTKSWNLTGVSELRAALDSKALTSVDLVRQCVERIESLDPKLGSVIELNPEWAAIARSLDQKSTAEAGPLRGIPVLLKDNIATHDQMVTAAGSAALDDSRAPFDSGVAARLRASGAVLLGKTNMSEWANFRSTNSTSGWSARGGQCRNPYGLERSPCGSSSGSAAAVAAGFAPLAVGTETVGSVVCPSGTCGIVGIKPTPDLIPGDGIIPIATTWDSAGAMGRTVSDATWLLNALSGFDFRSSLSPGALKGARIGVGRSVFGFDTRVDALMEKQLAILRSMGAELIDPVELPSWSEFGALGLEVMMYEFKAGLNAYLTRLGPSSQTKSLADVIAFNAAHPELEAMSYLGQDLLIGSQAKGPLTENAYKTALAKLRRAMREDGLDKVFAKHHLDAVVSPTNGPAWTIDLVNGDHFEGGGAAPAAVGGYPHITVPAGYVMDLPIGLSLYGPVHSEARLIALAYDYEQKTHHRVEPKRLGPEGA